MIGGCGAAASDDTMLDLQPGRLVRLVRADARVERDRNRAVCKARQHQTGDADDGRSHQSLTQLNPPPVATDLPPTQRSSRQAL